MSVDCLCSIASSGALTTLPSGDLHMGSLSAVAVAPLFMYLAYHRTLQARQESSTSTELWAVMVAELSLLCSGLLSLADGSWASLYLLGQAFCLGSSAHLLRHKHRAQHQNLSLQAKILTNFFGVTVFAQILLVV